MKKIFFAALVFNLSATAQTLTVEKIMQDPKWIGSSPSGVYWGYNSKQIYFNWNPDKAISDSVYTWQSGAAMPIKVKYTDAQFAAAAAGGDYNKARTKKVFTYNGDVYLLELINNAVKKITSTLDFEGNASFIMNEEWIAYQRNGNLFAWSIASGITKQLTDFEKEKPAERKTDQQSAWLQQQQLNTSDVLKQRKEKREARSAFLKQNKEPDTLHIIYTEDKSVRSLQISPGGRYVTYNLVKEADNVKRADVPSYVTESGYIAELPSRPNVGAPKSTSVFYLFDRIKDTVITVKMDSLPGITEKPAYTKDYPAKKDSAKLMRKVTVTDVYWNEEGSIAILDIRANDFKDRWLVQLNTDNGKLKPIDRQHNDAWIGGPGIGWLDGANAGWINENVFFYQSETSGYSHLYTYDAGTGLNKQLTSGNYEIQRATLSSNKKYFYIVSNEEHPGKQNFYRINSDGTGKIKLTSKTGMYDVSLSPDEKFIAYRYSYQNKPWELFVQENAPGKPAVQITNKAISTEWAAYPWRDPKILSFKNRDGQDVYARVYEPAAGKKNNAAVIFVHGAGYLQNVHYGWSSYFREYMFNNLLCDKGYTVMDIDYRASAGYGRDWRTAIYRHMGGNDLNDEVDAAKFLVSEYGVDAGRIGMYGGSYGGFMTLMALFTQPGVFKAGAALRPVTDWSHYNDGYTAAILNEPYNDSIAYKRSSPINFATGLKDHLLICHGMVDVNVHYQDAVRLAQRLIELGKDNWELASFPMEDHGFVEPSSWTDEYKRILKLFDSQLLK